MDLSVPRNLSLWMFKFVDFLQFRPSDLAQIETIYPIFSARWHHLHQKAQKKANRRCHFPGPPSRAYREQDLPKPLGMTMVVAPENEPPNGGCRPPSPTPANESPGIEPQHRAAAVRQCKVGTKLPKNSAKAACLAELPAPTRHHRPAWASDWPTTFVRPCPRTLALGVDAKPRHPVQR